MRSFSNLADIIFKRTRDDTNFLASFEFLAGVQYPLAIRCRDQILDQSPRQCERPVLDAQQMRYANR